MTSQRERVSAFKELLDGLEPLLVGLKKCGHTAEALRHMHIAFRSIHSSLCPSGQLLYALLNACMSCVLDGISDRYENAFSPDAKKVWQVRDPPLPGEGPCETVTSSWHACVIAFRVHSRVQHLLSSSGMCESCV